MVVLRRFQCTAPSSVPNDGGIVVRTRRPGHKGVAKLHVNLGAHLHVGVRIEGGAGGDLHRHIKVDEERHRAFIKVGVVVRLCVCLLLLL